MSGGGEPLDVWTEYGVHLAPDLIAPVADRETGWLVAGRARQLVTRQMVRSVGGRPRRAIVQTGPWRPEHPPKDSP